MSYWHEPRKEDIDFSEDWEEMHIYLYSDKNGAVYVSLKVKDIRDLLTKPNK